jgi:GTPase SAR1 family protein
MITINQSDKILLIGYSGSGKTTLMNWILKNSLPKFKNIIYIDSVFYFYKPNVDLKFNGFIGKYKKNLFIFHYGDNNELEKLLYKLNSYREPVFLIIDEIDQYTGSNSISQELKIYVEQGRNFQKGGMFSIRRLGFLNKSFMQSHYIFIFHTSLQRDIDYFSNLSGINFSDYNIRLKPHEFYIFDTHTTEIHGKYILDMDKNLK